MLKYLTDQLRGSFSLVVLASTTIFFSLLLYLVALLKLIMPAESLRIGCTKLANAIAQGWVGCNNLGLQLTKNIHWDIQGVEDTLPPDGWYLVMANHQSMVDIVILQKTFYGRIPALKFFLKKELIWVPFLGAAWWVLDFPFMKRTSSARRDLETARKACEKFKAIPVTVMNFVEGTRFSAANRNKQRSPFTRLLKPKGGGIAVVLETLGEQLHSILDVTIAYPEGVPGLWTFLCSKTLEFKVRVRRIPVTAELMGDYFADRKFRQQFNNWLNELWNEKDMLIGTLIQPADHRSGPVEED